MRRLATAFMLAVFTATLSIVATPGSATADPGMTRRCPQGSHWVPAHRDRQGRWVPGHCKQRRT